MNYLADTHALIWYFAEDERLGEKAEEVLTQAEEQKVTIFLPTIVLAEAEAVAHKYNYRNKLLTLIRKLKENPSFQVYPFDETVLKTYFQTDHDLEIHDRVIVATAKITQSTIITKDEKIKNLREVKIIW